MSPIPKIMRLSVILHFLFIMTNSIRLHEYQSSLLRYRHFWWKNFSCSFVRIQRMTYTVGKYLNHTHLVTFPKPKIKLYSLVTFQNPSPYRTKQNLKLSQWDRRYSSHWKTTRSRFRPLLLLPLFGPMFPPITMFPTLLNLRSINRQCHNLKLLIKGCQTINNIPLNLYRK